MNRRIERYYPYFLALCAGVAVGIICRQCADQVFPKSADILNSSITVAAIFAGFLATVKSMLVSMTSPTLEKLKKTSFYNLLIDYLAEGIWVAIIFCAFCMFGYFITDRGSTFAVVWTVLATSSIMTWVRVTRTFLKLMRADLQHVIEGQ